MGLELTGFMTVGEIVVDMPKYICAYIVEKCSHDVQKTWSGGY